MLAVMVCRHGCESPSGDAAWMLCYVAHKDDAGCGLSSRDAGHYIT